VLQYTRAPLDPLGVQKQSAKAENQPTCVADFCLWDCPSTHDSSPISLDPFSSLQAFLRTALKTPRANLQLNTIRSRRETPTDGNSKPLPAEICGGSLHHHPNTCKASGFKHQPAAALSAARFHHKLARTFSTTTSSYLNSELYKTQELSVYMVCSMTAYACDALLIACGWC
jgi:hypothetical protein